MNECAVVKSEDGRVTTDIFGQVIKPGETVVYATVLEGDPNEAVLRTGKVTSVRVNNRELGTKYMIRVERDGQSFLVRDLTKVAVVTQQLLPHVHPSLRTVEKKSNGAVPKVQER